jgi:tyrosine-specific transport protein
MPNKHLLGSISTLIGFTIGAGILGIPFVVSKAGFLTGILNILVIGILILILNLYLGEVSLRTKGIHQLTGYARTYLGNKGYYLMLISFGISSYGALVAYIIKVGEFINVLLNPLFGGTALIYSLIFFTITFLLICKGIKIIEKSESLMVTMIFIVIIAITIFAIPHINVNNLATSQTTSFFMPYGVVLFAFLASPAIPEINEELKNNKKYMKKAIIIGSIIPIIVYTLFALIVVGLTGINTTDGAILGLATILGNKILILGSIFGILTMTTSFIAVAFALTEMYHFDYKIKKGLSCILSCFIALIISILIIASNIKNAFFRVLDLTGAFGGSMAGILIVLIWWKAKKLGNRKPEYSINKKESISIILIIMFILGIAFKLYEILKI